MEKKCVNCKYWNHLQGDFGFCTKEVDATNMFSEGFVTCEVFKAEDSCEDFTPKKDKLDIIVELQDMLNDKVGLSQAKAMELPFEERMAWIRRYLEAAITEIGEALVEAGMKWWKKHYDEEALKEELIDVLHFLLSAMLLSGMNSKDIYDAYLKKNEKNFTRKDWDANK